ncbi:MAG: hypothetical protein JRI71_11920 [Deltaproteobacteria bacterium]|nr:hypothetical protein [Deltaproteobacteria bacterium]
MKMSRARAVREWAAKAVDKYYLGFVLLSEKISRSYEDYKPFFYAHGLEMLCKAYIIGDRHSQYKDLSFRAAKAKIDKIAKDFGHNLRKCIEELSRRTAFPSGFMNKVHYHSSINEVDLTNLDMLNTLQDVYLEARYPVVELNYQRYYREKVRNNPKAINKRYPEILMYSHELERFSIKLFRIILPRIEKDFRLKLPRDKFCSDIRDEDWERFSNLFFNN